MLQLSFIAFLAGWALWFLLDKPAGPMPPAPADSGWLGNFQFAFDLLKAGHPELGYLYIWQQHPILLALLAGALLSMLVGAIKGLRGRRRMRRLLLTDPEARRRAGRD